MITLVPAYGRTYNTRKSAMQDWADGKDFRIYCGPYTSVRDKALLIDQYGGIEIRYNATRDPIILTD